MKKLVINGLIVLICVVVVISIAVGLLKNVVSPEDMADIDVEESASMDLAGNAVEVKEQTNVNVVEKEEFSLNLDKLDELEDLT